jgi:hypothetical protein
MSRKILLEVSSFQKTIINRSHMHIFEPSSQKAFRNSDVIGRISIPIT